MPVILGNKRLAHPQRFALSFGMTTALEPFQTRLHLALHFAQRCVAQILIGAGQLQKGPVEARQLVQWNRALEGGPIYPRRRHLDIFLERVGDELALDENLAILLFDAAFTL